MVVNGFVRALVFVVLGALLTYTNSVLAQSNDEVVLFQSKSDSRQRYYYRIPSLVVIKSSGHVIAFAEQRVASNEDSGDINIVYRVSDDHGETWSRIHRACELGRNTCGNPTAVVDQRTGKIHLFMNANIGTKGQFHDDPQRRFVNGDRRILYMSAEVGRNNQLAFSEIQDLTGDGRQPSFLSKYVTYPEVAGPRLQPSNFKMDMVGPGAGIQLEQSINRGRLIIPAARRAIISDDGGQNWRLSNSMMPNVSSEASIMELDDGKVVRNDRATGVLKCVKERVRVRGRWVERLKFGSPKCRRVTSVSKDRGESFDDINLNVQLLDPISQGSMLRYSEGNMFMANCASTVRRQHLRIKRTTDGRNWRPSVYVSRDCGYSSLAKTRDYNLAILFERKGVPRTSPNEKHPQDLIFKKYKLRDLD